MLPKVNKSIFIEQLNEYYTGKLKPYMLNYPNQKEQELEAVSSSLTCLFKKHVEGGIDAKELCNTSQDRMLIFTYLHNITNPLLELNIIKHIVSTANDTIVIAGCMHITNILAAMRLINKKYTSDTLLSMPVLDRSQLNEMEIV